MLGQQGRQFATVRRYHAAPPYVQINYPPQPVYDQASPSNFYFQRQQTPYLLLQQLPPFSQLQQPVQYCGQAGQVPQSRQPALHTQVFQQSQVGGLYLQTNPQIAQPYQGSGQRGYQVVQQPAQYFHFAPRDPYLLTQRQQARYFQAPTQVSYERHLTVPSHLQHPLYSQGPINYPLQYQERVGQQVYQPHHGMGFQPVYQPQQVHYPVNLHEVKRSIEMRPNISETSPSFVSQPQTQQPLLADAETTYGFRVHNGKIIFAYGENDNVPLFSKYFRGVRSYLGMYDYKENSYTSALVFEQKIKEIGRFFNTYDLDTLSNPEVLLKLKDSTGKTLLKDSTNTTQNKINNIFTKNKDKEEFKNNITATLQKGIDLRTKYDPRANGLRNALLTREDLTKEEAGQIAKAISILDAGTEEGDLNVGKKIKELLRKYPNQQAQTQPQTQPQPSKSIVKRVRFDDNQEHR